jgi:hypothetical protein
MNAKQSLPAAFEVLEPFVDKWAVATTALRARCRSDSTPDERETFFNAVVPMLEPAMAYLDAKPLAELDAADKRLLNLMLSFSHVQMAVEVLQGAEPRHALSREAMIITRTTTDLV